MGKASYIGLIACKNQDGKHKYCIVLGEVVAVGLDRNEMVNVSKYYTYTHTHTHTHTHTG